ncbi:amidohydrolase family protein [bacterium]|nr:amidohydrolase family protein [bacterium]
MEIVSAKYLLTMNDGEIIEDGALAIELDKIERVGKKEELQKAYPDANHKDYPDCVLMPGLINSHVHLELTEPMAVRNLSLSEEMTPPDYVEWLINSLEYVKEAPKDELISRIQDGTSELINAGHTCIGNMCSFEGAINILAEMGIRSLTFLQIFSGANVPAKDLFETAIGIAERQLDMSTNLTNVGLGPYAPYLLSRQLLKILSTHAKGSDIPIQTHTSESFAEMELFYNSQGPLMTELFPSVGWLGDPPPANYKTPIAYLNDIGFLEAQPSIVGCIHLSDEDYRSLARNMVRVIYCPRNNHIMQHGKLPYNKLKENGIPMALGSNYAIGPLGNSLWEEMRMALRSGANQPPSAKELLTMATIGGARALRLDHLTGSLNEGKCADYIVVQAPQVNNVDEIWTKLIANTKAHSVKEVIVNGQVLKASSTSTNE